MSYRFFICDVFTTERFGGNQLAVLPEAAGLSGEQMQKIAREFNYSESTFVLPSEECDRQVRIFTPTIEVPFAGHPNIGTAFALATAGEFGDIDTERTVVFDEKAGRVPVRIRPEEGGRLWCELEAPEDLSLGKEIDVEQAARALCLDAGDIETATHPPREASVGLPFLFVELKSMEALKAARADVSVLEELHEAGITPDIHLYVRCDDDVDIRARMFAPLDGVPEDPATGSANCALVGLLTSSGVGNRDGDAWRIAQGVEMGRPSLLEARTRRDGDAIRSLIAGYSVLVAEGTIDVDNA